MDRAYLQTTDINTRIDKFLLIYILLASSDFYKLSLIPAPLLKVLSLSSIFLLIFIIAVHRVYDKASPITRSYSVGIWLLFCGMLLSMFGAYYFHYQSVGITLYAQRPIYFFLLYFALFWLKPSINELFKLILALGILYCFIYFLQTIIYPIKIIDTSIFWDRGTLRIFMPGFVYMFLSYFISLNLYFTTKKTIYLAIVFSCLIVLILLGTRQSLAPVILLTILYILLSKRVKSKILVFSLVVLCIIPLYFVFYDIITAMNMATRKHAVDIAGNTRFLAARFFLFEFFPKKLAYLIGNGAYGSDSIYAKKIEEYTSVFGFYQSDIGIIGEYAKYGVLFVVGELIILFRLLLTKVSDHIAVCTKTYALATFMTIVLGAGAFSSATEIAPICILLYMIDVDQYMLKHKPKHL